MEIEAEFKVVFKAQDKMPKGKHKRGKEKVSYRNHALSTYAAMLTVEFLVKVGLNNYNNSNNNNYYSNKIKLIIKISENTEQ